MPKPKQHKILGQVIEIDGCTHDDEEHVRSLMRATYYKRLLASIDRICSELNAPDHLSTPLAPESIREPLTTISEIARLHQPYSSFGGNLVVSN